MNFKILMIVLCIFQVFNFAFNIYNFCELKKMKNVNPVQIIESEHLPSVSSQTIKEVKTNQLQKESLELHKINEDRKNWLEEIEKERKLQHNGSEKSETPGVYK